MRVRLLLCTWNVGNAKPRLEELGPWLGKTIPLETEEGVRVDSELLNPYDIVVIGAQESDYDPMADSTSSPKDVEDMEDELESPRTRFEDPEDCVVDDVNPYTEYRGVNSPEDEYGNLIEDGIGNTIGLLTETYAQWEGVDEEIADEEDGEDLIHVDSVKSVDVQAVAADGIGESEEGSFPSFRLQGVIKDLDSNTHAASHRLSANSSRGPLVTTKKDSLGQKIKKIFKRGKDRGSMSSFGTMEDRDDSKKDAGPRASLEYDSESTTQDETSDTSDAGQDEDGSLVRRSLSRLSSLDGNRPKRAAQGAKTATPWVSDIEEAMGSDFTLVERVALMQMRILLFVRSGKLSLIEKTHCEKVGTGVADVVGNKGAVSISVKIQDTTMCFISTHLAAHEGEKYRKERKKDVVAILRFFQRGGWIPLMHKYDHVFWMGDLNYRIDPSYTHPEAEKWTFDVRREFVVKLMEMGQRDELLANDELIRERRRKDVFAYFQEGQITFEPTFKMKRSVGSVYAQSRIPSYCDRVLWFSLPRSRQLVTQLAYRSFPSISTSDHKPVHAGFEIEIPAPLPGPLALHQVGIRPTLVICGVRASGPFMAGASADDMNAKSMGRKYLEVFGFGLFVSKRGYLTTLRLRDQRLVSYNAKGLLSIPCVCVSNMDLLLSKYITFVIHRDNSKVSYSAILAFEAIAAPQLMGKRRKVKLLLTRFGTPSGEIELDIALVTNASKQWIDLKSAVILDGAKLASGLSASRSPKGNNFVSDYWQKDSIWGNKPVVVPKVLLEGSSGMKRPKQGGYESPNGASPGSPIETPSSPHRNVAAYLPASFSNANKAYGKQAIQQDFSDLAAKLENLNTALPNTGVLRQANLINEADVSSPTGRARDTARGLKDQAESDPAQFFPKKASASDIGRRITPVRIPSPGTGASPKGIKKSPGNDHQRPLSPTKSRPSPASNNESPSLLQLIAGLEGSSDGQEGMTSGSEKSVGNQARVRRTNKLGRPSSPQNLMDFSSAVESSVGMKRGSESAYESSLGRANAPGPENLNSSLDAVPTSISKLESTESDASVSSVGSVDENRLRRRRSATGQPARASMRLSKGRTAHSRRSSIATVPENPSTSSSTSPLRQSAREALASRTKTR